MEEKTRTNPTETQLEVLMSDWMGNLRKGGEENFIHRGKRGFRTKRKGGITDYLLENVDGMHMLDLVKHGRAAAEKVINAIAPNPVRVVVGDKDSYNTCTDGGDLIALATDYFNDGTLSNRQKVSVMLGLACHEAAHSAYTESDAIERVIAPEKPEFKMLRKEIWNLIEDERIEYLLGEEHPGFAESIGTVKEHYFKYMTEQMKTAGKMPTEPLPKLLAALTLAVRYPSEMTREQAEENFEELDTIRRTLTPYPLRSQDAIDATGRIMDIIRDMAKKEAENRKQQQEEQQQQQQNSDGKGGEQKQDEKSRSSSQQNGGGQPASGEASLFDEKGNPSGGDGPDKKQGPKPKPKVSQKEIEEALKDMLSTQQAKNVLEAIKSENDKGEGKNECREIKDGNAKRYANEADAECTMAGSGNPKDFVFKPKGDADEYMRSERAVRAFVPAMSKSLACKSHDRQYVLQGMPSGRLNTNKLVSIESGNYNIFTKSGKVTCSSASVVMLIDESGSMDGGKLLAARQAAILINEAVKRISNVNFYCYGYTTNQLNVYSEAGKTSKWALGETAAIGGTPTGKAMDKVAQRVRRFTSDPCLMLVLTDGYPDSSEEVIRMDEKLRRSNFSPIGVGILCNAVTSTFKESVVMMDISRFAFELGKITRGRLDKMLVRKDSMN